MPQDKYPFELPPLPYAYDALEPVIDTETVHLHHDRHFATYLDRLNKALEPYPRLQRYTLEQLILNARNMPPAIRAPIHNNAGGVYNHTLYFAGMVPESQWRPPQSKLLEAIERSYFSFERFLQEFAGQALAVFGSGWTYLVRIRRGEVRIVSGANQDTPLPMGQFPLMCIDVWEHAYYLKYQNRRDDYIAAYPRIIGWEEAERRYESPPANMTRE